MEEDKDREEVRNSIHLWAQKGEIEKSLAFGMNRMPKIKEEEKSYYLGEFKERIVRFLMKKQVEESAIYPEIVTALEDTRADKMLISGEIESQATQKYERLARRMKKSFTVVHDPKLRGEIGLVVASNQAIEVENIAVEDRLPRLKNLGISEEIAQAAGKKVCKQCYDSIVKVDPGEAINYQPLTWADQFWGERCPVEKGQ